ncbi:MAG: RagB/SusD family nutrient uptake outer membrane protein [Prevotellaceae bacterium]|nr:RagB/SusD family nutrient uptake outer membrane protein [Prevotellaceae bacterium]
MKKYSKIKLMGALSLLGISVSCGNEFLNVFPNDSLVTETAITSVAGANAALYGVYDLLQSTSLYNCNMITYAEVRGEDMQPVNRSARTSDFYTFNNRTPDNGNHNLWYYPYVGLNRINSIITAFDNGQVTDGSENQRNAILGQAYALRGFFHFDLVKLYGVPYLKDKTAPGIIIADHVITPAEVNQRATVADAYDQAVGDLTQALSLLSGTKIRTDGYINYWAAEALLARVYLYMGNYDEAFNKAKDVIDNSGYQLTPNNEYVASWALEFTKESLFDLVNIGTDNGDRESIGYVAKPEPDGYGALIATPVFIDLLEEDPDDIRLELLGVANDADTCYVAKFPGRGLTAVNNVRIIRLSEVYLIAAETALRKPVKNQTAADEYLDAIRKRANPAAPFISATTDEVLKERRKELVSEGHRFFDIMRLGLTVNRMANNAKAFLNAEEARTVGWDEHLCILPIPRYEIDINPELLVTPGYTW